MKFKQFLNEEPLNLVHAKKFKALGKDIGYKKRYKNIFGNEDRIYIKIPGSIRTSFDESLYDYIDEFITDEEYNLENKKDVDYVIHNRNDKDMNVVFTTYTNSGKKNNITYTYEELFKKNLHGKNREKYLNMIKYTPKQGAHKDLSIVISRNPCDIAGMSTNRGWKSCMNLYTGAYRHHVTDDVREGTLVVYLIDSDDKDILKPLSRKLIKPYVSLDKKTIYLKLTEPVYGNIFPKNAVKAVETWLSNHQKDITGYFELNKKLYNDNDDSNVYIGPTEKIKLEDNVKIKKEFIKNYRNIGDVVGIVKKIGNYSSTNMVGVYFSNYRLGSNLNGTLKGGKRYSGRWFNPYELEKVKETK